MNNLKIQITDKKCAKKIVRRLGNILQDCAEFSDFFSESSCSKLEKQEFQLLLGKLSLVCWEMIFQILMTHENIVIENCDLNQASQSINFYREMLGANRAEPYEHTAVLPRGAKYIICSEEKVAILSLERLKKIRAKINNLEKWSLRVIDNELERSQFHAEQFDLYTCEQALQCVFYIDHPNLVPDKTWKTVVEKYRSRIALKQ